MLLMGKKSKGKFRAFKKILKLEDKMGSAIVMFYKAIRERFVTISVD